jgi:predicted regulator of Ras-like GTPase activity (Roadblock/LC7/MglB family)
MWNSVKRLFWQPGDTDEPGAVDSASPASAQGRELVLLRDVPGVIGSVTVQLNGDVLACDLPRLFDAETVRQVATRIIQLYAAMSSDGSEFTNANIAYKGYQLHVERLTTGLLGVLAHENLDRAALGMAIRLIGRRLEKGQGPVSE